MSRTIRSQHIFTTKRVFITLIMVIYDLFGIEYGLGKMARNGNSRRQRIKIFVLVGLAALSLNGCGRTNVTGHYIAKFVNGVYGLQLVQSSDGRLTGQLDDVVTNSAGKIVYASFMASGIADGQNVSLSFKQASGLDTLAGSGTIDGDHLSLTGTVNPNSVSTVDFVRADTAQYQSLVSRLIQSANSAAQSKASAQHQIELAGKEQRFASAVEALVNNIQKFDADADAHLTRWPSAEQSFRQITAKMNADLNQERNTTGDGAAAVRRGQIVVAMEQLSTSTDQMHFQVMTLQNSFQTNIVPQMKLMDAVLTRCYSKDIVLLGDAVKNSCADISRVRETFSQKYASFGNGLARLNSIYQDEYSKQHQLMLASQQIN